MTGAGPIPPVTKIGFRPPKEGVPPLPAAGLPPTLLPAAAGPPAALGLPLVPVVPPRSATPPQPRPRPVPISTMAANKRCGDDSSVWLMRHLGFANVEGQVGSSRARLRRARL